MSGAVNLQICDDQMCFAPEELKFSLPAKVVPKDAKVELTEPALFAEYAARRSSPAKSPATAPATQRAAVGPTMIGDDGAAWSTPFAFGAAFLAGLLFNIMPCVLPVLPIKAKGFYE